MPPAAGAMATELVLRGWENVYVLSGGALSSERKRGWVCLGMSIYMCVYVMSLSVLSRDKHLGPDLSSSKT